MVVLWIACVSGGGLAGQGMGATGSISGLVEDQTGAVIRGAAVTVTADGSTVTQTTDSRGRFRIEHVPSRHVQISVRAAGFTATERTIDVENAHDLRIVLAPAPLTERITVTATRTPTRLSETAADTVVLTAQDLDATPALTLDDKLRQLPGFRLFRRSGSRTANPTSQGVSLRGTGASGASRALVLEDGVPLNDPFGGWVYWDRVPRESVRDVEVVRGGASSLYGSDAMGGVINVLTRRINESVLSFESSYGNENTPDASLSASTRRGRWAAGVSGEAFHTDGYILVPRDARGSVDVPAGSDDRTLDFRLEREISHTARAFARGSYFGEGRANGTIDQSNRTHSRQLAAGADWQWQGAGAFSVRADGGPEIFDQNFFSVALDRARESLTRVQRVPSRGLGGSAQWSRPVGDRQTWVAGIEGEGVRGASDELIFGRCPAPPGACSGLNPPLVSAVGAGGRQDIVGIYGENTIRLTPDWILTASGRIDRWSNNRGLSTTRSLRPRGTVAVTSFPGRTESALSPRVAVLHRLTSNLSLYTAAYQAFRAPTLNELYRSFRLGNIVTLANNNLRAERLTGAEVGAAASVFRDRLAARGTFFWSEISRPIANVTLTLTPTLVTRQRQNLGRTRSRGVDVDFTGRITSALGISGGYQFTDATVLSFPANLGLVGLRVPEVPRHEVTWRVTYAHPSGVTLGIEGRAESAAYDDDLNTLRLGPYSTLDAIVSRRLKQGLELFAAAENLFDQRYPVAETPTLNLGPPILFRAGIRVNLGRP